MKQAPCTCRAKRYVGTCNSYNYSISICMVCLVRARTYRVISTMPARSRCRYIMLITLNVPHVPRPCFIAPCKYVPLNRILFQTSNRTRFVRLIKFKFHLNISSMYILFCSLQVAQNNVFVMSR